MRKLLTSTKRLHNTRRFFKNRNFYFLIETTSKEYTGAQPHRRIMRSLHILFSPSLKVQNQITTDFIQQFAIDMCHLSAISKSSACNEPDSNKDAGPSRYLEDRVQDMFDKTENPFMVSRRYSSIIHFYSTFGSH